MDVGQTLLIIAGCLWIGQFIGSKAAYRQAYKDGWRAKAESMWRARQ